MITLLRILVIYSLNVRLENSMRLFYKKSKQRKLASLSAQHSRISVNLIFWKSNESVLLCGPPSWNTY